MDIGGYKVELLGRDIGGDKVGLLGRGNLNMMSFPVVSVY